MKVTVFYVGSSLLAPLRHAERDINREHGLDLRVTTYNFGSPLTEDEWKKIDSDLSDSDIVFVIHVMDGENAARLMPALERHGSRHRAVIVINCMPELMKRTRMGGLDVSSFTRRSDAETGRHGDAAKERGQAMRLLGAVAAWVGNQTRARRSNNGHGRAQYLKFIDRLPGLLRLLPNAGRLRDVKNYLYLVCYFLQPTPANIRSMVLHALKHYVPDPRLERIKVPKPEAMPSVAIYHPDAPSLFESFEAYDRWYSKRGSKSSQALSSKLKAQSSKLNPASTIGLLLMRPQIVSNTRKHYDGLIRAIESEGLSVIPAISTLMDNRQACEKFFLRREKASTHERRDTRQGAETDSRDFVDNPLQSAKKTIHEDTRKNRVCSRSRVSQIVSLTGFSFVGGPAMNDSAAAAEFLVDLNVPFRSMVSLDTQTIDSWRESFAGLNPIQTGMQVAIPEIDGATEPFVFGGIPERGVEPAPLDDRCRRIARRLSRWNRLQAAPPDQLRVALVLYCFPPNKGNIGTAADLDVFASLFDVLVRMNHEGYYVDVPDDANSLREMLLGGNSVQMGATANVAHQMSVDDYRRVCPFVSEIENEWGPAPGSINSFGGELLIQGLMLGNIFIGVQPTFGYEDDPMRLLMAKGGTPHHGFAAFYTYLEKVFQADAVVHVGTHGAMEFMPGKQVGLSAECWPDRLIGELPNLYIYSVNNPSEGTIAKRRSYAELISYLTPPIENAGLYKGLASLKDSIMAYRQATDGDERQRLFSVIEEARRDLNLGL